jgi:hypothetical protein
MRTIIFIGLLSIASAINPNWMKQDQLWFYQMVFLGALIGDMYVTMQNKSKKQ